eukprot:jgi/Chlat1/9048/Chrsp94S08311
MACLSPMKLRDLQPMAPFNMVVRRPSFTSPRSKLEQMEETGCFSPPALQLPKSFQDWQQGANESHMEPPSDSALNMDDANSLSRSV